MLLNEILTRLARQGCYPCISYRGGGVWRAHINGAGNYWEDRESPRAALLTAMAAWEKAGKPMDGYADRESHCDHPWHRNAGLITQCPECGTGGSDG